MAWGLLGVDHAEESGEIIVRASGEVKLIEGPVFAQPVAKFDAPELVDLDHVAIGVFHGAEKLAGDGVKAVDGAAVGVVRDQQGVAEYAEVFGRDGEPPRLVQRRAAHKLLQERSVFAEDVDITAGSA